MQREQKPGQIGDYWLSTNRHGVWCRTWYDARARQTKRATLGTRDFEGAVLRLAEWIVLNQRIEKAAAADVPLLIVLKRYHEHYAKRHTARDGEMSAIAIGKAEAFFAADEPVSEFNRLRQLEFEDQLREQDYSDGYIGRIQTVIKAALNYAYMAEEIASVPHVRVLSAGKRDRVLTLKEAAALFNADPPEHMLMFLMVAFCTLARSRATILELQPFQIDFERRLIHLNPPDRRQTKKYRPTLPIVDTLLPWLHARRGQRYLVQYAKEQQQPLGSVKTAWARLKRDASAILQADDPRHPGLGPDVIPYTIRHTMASELRRRHVPKWEVEGWLGHKAGTTDLYAHFAPDYLSVGAAAIDDYFRELQPHVERELIFTNVTPLHGRGSKA